MHTFTLFTLLCQVNTLEDRNVPDKMQWDSAIRFLERSLQERLDSTEANLREQVGPGFYERWFQWQGASEQQKTKAATRVELERILASVGDHRTHLSLEEMTTIKRNLQLAGVDVEGDLIRDTWHPVYRRHFLRRSLGRCYDCRRGFYMYNQGLETEVETTISSTNVQKWAMRIPFFLVGGLQRCGSLLEDPADAEGHSQRPKATGKICPHRIQPIFC